MTRIKLNTKRIEQLRSQGYSIRLIAIKLRVSQDTIKRRLKELKVTEQHEKNNRPF
jgi:DNA invertase Pin-like site-specific DNA recombinase